MIEPKKKALQWSEIAIIKVGLENYISMTNMLKAKDSDFLYFCLVGVEIL